MDRILLPLRSNAGWFTHEDAHAALERQLKNLVINFEQVAVQDGRYITTIWKDGTHIEFMIPPNQISAERSGVDFFDPVYEPMLLIGGRQLARGPAEISYTVDFAPLFERAGLRNAEYIQWLHGDISPAASKHIKATVAEPRGSRARRLPPQLRAMSRRRRKSVVESLLIDTAIATSLRIPFLTDINAGPVIQWHNAQAFAGLAPVMRAAVYQEWVMLGLPDLAGATWEEIHRIRESSVGADYRSMLRRVEHNVMAALAAGLPPVDIEREIRRMIVAELTDTISEMAPSTGGAALGLAWNLVPWGSWFSAGSDVREIMQHRQSWVALLKGSEDRSP